MAKVHIRDEVMYTAPTRIGLLADVTEALQATGVNIEAIGAYDKGGNGEFLMVTSDNQLALDTLSKFEGEVSLQQVVVAEVPNQPGQLAAIARVLAANDINVDQVFATSVDGAEKVMIVLTAPCEVDILALLEHV